MSIQGQRKAAPRIAAVGCGYWGKNIVRNLAELGALTAVSDASSDIASQFGRKFNVPSMSLAEIVASDEFDAVAFATPASMHEEHTLAALESGKHVFVEKPLALTVAGGRRVADLARKKNRILMVGHLLHYHPLVIRLLELVREGRFGRIEHVHSSRLNLGKLRVEEDVLWSFAPHDISVILAIVGALPHSVQLLSNTIISPNVADIAYLHMHFSEGVLATAFASWLNPFKEQKLVVVGSEAHAVFDDTLAWDDKLAIFDHKVSISGGAPVAIKGEPQKVVVPQQEPLLAECRHFVECVAEGRQPRTDSAEAMRVLSVLDAATRSGQTGKPVTPDVVG